MTYQHNQSNELNTIQFIKHHDSHVLMYQVQQAQLHNDQKVQNNIAGYQYYVHTMFDFKE